MGLKNLHFFSSCSFLIATSFQAIVHSERFSRWLILLPLFCSIIACGPEGTTSTVQVPDKISFNFDVQPILSNNCYVCHGPDSSTRQAGLRLDLREQAIRTLKSGNRAIHPGNWKKSELINRVTSQNPEEMMPPPEMKRQLSEKEVAILTRWIEQGAEWEPYWAFTAASQPVIPEVSSPEYVNNQIDQFIVSRLEDQQLTPAEVADRHKLARRLSYILTGLPPDPDKLQEFVEDQHPDAYQKLVDHYLASDRFGEHWARHWMDLVRYADTRGHEFDYPVIGAWRYRDYLIRAINQDVPYDQLVLEHLAGDMLDTPRYHPSTGANESVIGTAFYCLSEGKHSPVDLRIDQSERIDNIIDVTSKTFQALTVACAKCHDHKFDPIPTSDYYSMYGMIESTRFTLTQAGFSSEQQLLVDSIDQDRLQLRNYIVNNLSTTPPDPIKARVSNREISDYQVIGDFRDGDLSGWIADGYSIVNGIGTPEIHGDRVKGLKPAMVSSCVYGKGVFGVLRSPGFVIKKDSMLFRAAGKNSVIRVILDNFQLIQDPIYGQLQTHLKSEQLQDYKIDVSMWKGHRAYIELLVGDYKRRENKSIQDYVLDQQAWLETAYVFGYDSLAPLETNVSESLTQGGQALLNKWASGKTNALEVAALDNWFSQKNVVIPGLQALVREYKNAAGSLHDSSFVVGVTDGDHIKSPVFIRGSLKTLSDYQVPHRYLTAISDTNKVFGQQGSGRLEFALQVANNSNPLTARVMVNRLWHHLFGRGIVETVDNFGVQGKIPSHPELLDFLALKFMEDDWSIKKMIRFMVTSQAFQRDTSPSPDMQAVDPENILLQHYPVRRLSAESIRDAILAVSGELDTTMYGPPVPIYLTDFLTGRGRPRKSGPLDGAGRRSIYQALNRNFLSPMMLAFDMPIPFSTFGRRNVSNVPAQSLTMLNDPFVLNQAGLWAEEVAQKEKDFEPRVQQIYLSAFSREADASDITKAMDYFNEQQISFSEHVSEEQQEQELWKSYCHSIFNMKEFIFLI